MGQGDRAILSLTELPLIRRVPDEGRALSISQSALGALRRGGNRQITPDRERGGGIDAGKDVGVAAQPVGESSSARRNTHPAEGLPKGDNRRFWPAPRST